MLDDSKLNYLLGNSNSFKDRLNINQKKALWIALNMMSLTSTNFDPQKDNFTAIGRILFHLGIQVKQEGTDNVDVSNHIEILKTLSHVEKIWFLSILVFIANIPGEISENSIQNILKKGLEIGVPIDQITEIIFLT
jgi:hypothetical protein